ncbi:RICIN domain-containing protein [Hymenobacter arcticus]
MRRPFFWVLLACLGGGLAPQAQAQTTEPYNWNSIAIGGGGFVSGLVMSKTQAGLYYARTDVGGAYRYDTAAAKWVPLMDGASELEQGMFGVESLALDPQNSSTLYAFCGISYFNNGRTYIMRSTDYGATFTTIDVTAQFKAHGNGMGRGNGEKLQVDPSSSSTLYCGTRYNGIWKSTNSGTTWTNLTSLPVTVTPNGNGLSFVLVDNTSAAAGGASQRVFAGVSRNSGAGANFYRSDDAGATFTAVTNPNLGASMMPQRAVQAGGSLYISYGNGSGPYGTTFAATATLPASNEAYDAGQIWKYDIAAGTWTNLTPTTGTNRAFGGISVDRNNPNRIIISTCNSYLQQGPTSSSPYGDRFFLTTDGGTTWTDVVARGYTFDPNGITWIPGQSIHWAASIEFDPFVPNRVLVDSGNGVYANDDITAPAGMWKFFVKGLEETVAQNLVSLPNGGPLLSTILDYDGFRQTDVAQYAPIYQPRIGSTNGLDFAKLSPANVVRVGSRSSSTAASVLLYSTDMGLTWTRTATMNGSNGQLALSADGGVLLHSPSNGASASFPVADNTFVYRTTDNGATWTKATGVPTTLTSSRPVADAVNPSKFYLHNTNTGEMLVSTDGGVSFAVAGNVGATGGSKIIRAVQGREGHLWVALYGGGLTRSVNSGTTFTKLANVTRCDAVGFGKAAPGSTYEAIYIYGVVGGVVGIFRSNDQGVSWVRVNDEAHEYGGPANGQFVMGDLNTYGRVYMSTAGRGIIYGMPATALASRPATSGPAALQAYPNPTGSALTLRLPPELVGGTVSVINTLGAVVRITTASRADYTLNLSQLPAGLYVVRVASGAQSATVRVVKQ